MHNGTYRHQLDSGETINFKIIQGSYRRKYISICITHDGQILINLPYTAKYKNATDAINQKIGWIKKHLSKISTRPKPPTLAYASGELHLYQGKWYPLSILQEQKSRLPLTERVFFNQHNIQIIPHTTTRYAIKNLLLSWYQDKAKQAIETQLKTLLPCISWIKGIPLWKIRRMNRCWGNCTLQGKITINTHLIKAPEICLDYVLLHELAHIKEHNHSHHYYIILAELMPEWKKIKIQLENLAPFILNH